MAKQIDPNNEKQLKKENIVAIINGGDKQEYTVTEKHPLIEKGEVKKGEVRTAHPHLVKKFVKNGWAKETGTPIVKADWPKSENE